MVVALLALFVALSGVGYATTVLPGRPAAAVVKANPVANLAKKHKKNKKTTVRVRCAAVTCPPDAPGPAGPRGATGSQGPIGPTGATGGPGATNVVIRFLDFTAGSGTPWVSSHLHVSCNPGEKAVGGGIGWTQSPSSNDGVIFTGPSAANFMTTGLPDQGSVPTGWEGEIKTNDTGKTGRLYVVCASP
jgi:hypothetical protein